ncbi:MAG: hypothetical protein QOJ04_6942, partial [Caballeronia sp.]|nr:hypothetical protein [Caballeronia sp.]
MNMAYVIEEKLHYGQMNQARGRHI